MKTFLYKIYINRLFYFIFLATTFFSSLKSYADHLAGSDFCVDFVSSQNGVNKYLVTFKVIRHCHGIQLSNYIDLTVRDINNQEIRTIRANMLNDIEYLSDCDKCYEIYDYQTYFEVDQSVSGFKIDWSINNCCRNSSPFYNGQPSFYNYVFINNQITGGNKTSCFKLQNNIACLGKPFSIDLNTLNDNDGDNLFFSLVSPLTNLNAPLMFSAGYDYIHPCQTLNNEGVTIQNGVLSFTPVGLAGNTVIAVKVQEYRNGILVGETVKEFTIIVKECPQTPPFSLGIEELSGGYISQLSNFEINTCVTEKLCFKLKSSDPEKRGTSISITSSINGANYTIKKAEGSNNDEVEFCWTPSYQDFGLHKFSYCVTDVSPCGLDAPLTQCYDVYINVDGCKEKDWCYHPCSPDLEDLDIILPSSNSAGVHFSSFNYPLRIAIINATGYELLIYNKWGNLIYSDYDYNPNGFDWREYKPSHPFPTDWVVKWDGRVGNRNNLTAYTFVSDVYAIRFIYWNCNEKKEYLGSVLYEGGAVYDPFNPLPFPYLGSYSHAILGTNCCEDNYVFETPHNETIKTFNATDYIIAKNNAKILNNQQISYIARNAISLLPNFVVEAGAVFNAKIQPCESDMNNEAKKDYITEIKDIDKRFGFNDKGNLSNNDMFSQEVLYLLTDISGRVLQSNVTIPHLERISVMSWASQNFNNLSSGIYLLVPNNRNYEVIKFIIH